MLKTMNIHRTAALTVTVLSLATVFAGPVDQTRIAADAKWVVHLDFDALRKSKLGNHLITGLLQPKIEQNDFIKKANLSINVTNISSLTAYGPQFEKEGEGVLLLSTTADVKKDMDTLVGMASLSENEKKDVTMLQQKPFPLYSMKDEVFIAPLGGNTVVLAKSREQIDHARDIANGKGESLAKAQSFKDYPEAANAFLLVMAKGFNESAKIPPQAQVLRETEGGRLAIGENDKNLFLNLMFKGKDEESSTKIQQVLQGIVALVSMSQQNKDVTDLASATKIASEGRNVSVTLQFPSAKAIQQLDKHVNLDVKKNAVRLDVKADEDAAEKSSEEEKK
jgi:hypothetical protein